MFVQPKHFDLDWPMAEAHKTSLVQLPRKGGGEHTENCRSTKYLWVLIEMMGASQLVLYVSSASLKELLTEFCIIYRVAAHLPYILQVKATVYHMKQLHLGGPCFSIQIHFHSLNCLDCSILDLLFCNQAEGSFVSSPYTMQKKGWASFHSSPFILYLRIIIKRY